MQNFFARVDPSYSSAHPKEERLHPTEPRFSPALGESFATRKYVCRSLSTSSPLNRTDPRRCVHEYRQTPGRLVSYVCFPNSGIHPRSCSRNSRLRSRYPQRSRWSILQSRGRRRRVVLPAPLIPRRQLSNRGRWQDQIPVKTLQRAVTLDSPCALSGTFPQGRGSGNAVVQPFPDTFASNRGDQLFSTAKHLLSRNGFRGFCAHFFSPPEHATVRLLQLILCLFFRRRLSSSSRYLRHAAHSNDIYRHARLYPGRTP